MTFVVVTRKLVVLIVDIDVCFAVVSMVGFLELLDTRKLVVDFGLVFVVMVSVVIAVVEVVFVADLDGVFVVIALIIFVTVVVV